MGRDILSWLRGKEWVYQAVEILKALPTVNAHSRGTAQAARMITCRPSTTATMAAPALPTPEKPLTSAIVARIETIQVWETEVTFTRAWKRYLRQDLIWLVQSLTPPSVTKMPGGGGHEADVRKGQTQPRRPLCAQD